MHRAASCPPPATAPAPRRPGRPWPPRPLRWACLAGVIAWGAASAWAAPRDAKVGDTRAVYRKEGTILREKPNLLSAALATLPSGARVTVTALQLPWMQVRAGEVTGWLRALETVEPEALGSNGPPSYATAPPPGAAADPRDVTAAGRQLDANTERGYRAGRQDLERGYALVDALERETARMDPAECIAFISEGWLGRSGRTYARPGRTPPEKAYAGMRRKRSPGDVAGKIGGELLRRLGGKKGRDAADVAEAVIGGAADFMAEVNKRFTPGQEYYLGRAVAAHALARYGVDPDPARRQYVRLVGEALVRTSARVPENYGGYHFEVLDSDEVNGISGPGGFVLLTRGAVRSCRSEDELAALIAHELAHVTLKHGEQVLRQGERFPAFVKSATQAAAAGLGVDDPGFVRELVRFFGNVAGEMSTTAVDHGYGRQLEFVADAEGTNLLYDVFYDHGALAAWLGHHAEGHRHHGATHAPPQARAQALAPLLQQLGPYATREGVLDGRIQRFASFRQGVAGN